MRNKKAPSLAAVGAGQEGGKVRDLAYPHSATPARPAQGECCANCQFFRRVALPSGHDRLLCQLTGEKFRSAAGWCDLFAPGKWEEIWADPNPSPLPKWLLRTAERLRALTHTCCLGHGGVPLTSRGVTRAFPASQELEKVVSHILLSKLLPDVCPVGCFRILAGHNVRVFVRPRRLLEGRGALCPAFFYSPNFEASMYPITFASVVAPSCNLIPAGEVRHA